MFEFACLEHKHASACPDYKSCCGLLTCAHFVTDSRKHYIPSFRRVLNLMKAVKLETLVVAVDGSEFSTSALNMAVHLSATLGSKLKIVNVVEFFPSMYMGLAEGMLSSPAVEEYYKLAREHSHRLLSRSVKLAKELGVDAEGISLEDVSPAQAIVNFSEKENAGLIVVGTRGLTGLKSALLGSVSRAVTEHARCSVLVAR